MTGHVVERVVVGFDTSPGAVVALAWAVAQARAHGATLELLTVDGPHPPSAGDLRWPAFTEAERAIAQAQDRALGAVDRADVPVVRRAVRGQPAHELARAGGDLLVVGARGHGGFVGLVLGSVADQVVAHAPSPVAVVPVDGPTGVPRRIVVGVDGSHAAEHALAWAAAHARCTGAAIEAVTAYRWPQVPLGPPWTAMATLSSHGLRDVEAAAEAALHRSLERVRTDDLAIEWTVAEGVAATRLLGRAQDADLLVVGSRGHGKVEGLLLGSTSRRVLHDPPVPVVVVR